MILPASFGSSKDLVLSEYGVLEYLHNTVYVFLRV